MEQESLVLRAYYEVLYEKLENNRGILMGKTARILSDEITKQGLEDFDDKKYTAYKEASIAFIDERIEAYDPTGIQYTFDNVRRKDVCELEMQLDWYDSRMEFAELLEAANKKCEDEMSDERMRELAKELVKECGAFPDKSIISGYEREPTLAKLPDYVAARAIEEIVR